jgi:hypothetical protein
MATDWAKLSKIYGLRKSSFSSSEAPTALGYSPPWAQTLIFSSLATFYDGCPEAESAH